MGAALAPTPAATSACSRSRRQSGKVRATQSRFNRGIGEGAVTAGQQMEQTDESVDLARGRFGNWLRHRHRDYWHGRWAIGDETWFAGWILPLQRERSAMASRPAQHWRRKRPMSASAWRSAACKKASSRKCRSRSTRTSVAERRHRKPWDEGVGEAMAQGLIAGTAMGAGVNALPRAVRPLSLSLIRKLNRSTE